MSTDGQFSGFAAGYDAGRAQIVFRRVVADLETPIGAYLKLAEGRRNTFLLESVQDGATRGRYSMIGFDPDIILKVVKGAASINRNAGLTPEAFEHSPFGARLAAMLVERDGKWYGLATLDGVHDPATLAGIAAQTGGTVRLLDLKSESETLVAQYRMRILQALGVAFLLLVLAVGLAFRDAHRAWHVLAPMTLATVLAIAVLRVCGVPLSLFHLVAVTLAAGLGLHYALFFERPVADAGEARRTLHATLVCVAAAVLVFGLLATSAVPVLRAIGATVALGVTFHFILSTQMAMRRNRDVG